MVSPAGFVVMVKVRVETRGIEMAAMAVIVVAAEAQMPACYGTTLPSIPAG